MDQSHFPVLSNIILGRLVITDRESLRHVQIPLRIRSTSNSQRLGISKEDTRSQKLRLNVIDQLHCSVKNSMPLRRLPLIVRDESLANKCSHLHLNILKIMSITNHLIRFS